METNCEACSSTEYAEMRLRASLILLPLASLVVCSQAARQRNSKPGTYAVFDTSMVGSGTMDTAPIAVKW